MSSRTTVVAAATIVASTVLVGTVLGQHAGHQGGARTVPTGQRATAAPKPAPAGALPPLPRVPYEPARPMPVVQQVYEFAARHPEVLRHVPCYCGCERLGHGGNHDCFVRSRAADGRITEWEAHGIGCQICIDVGRDAMMLFNSGASLTAIRDAIDRKYRAHFPSATPTPPPPKTGGTTGRRT